MKEIKKHDSVLVKFKPNWYIDKKYVYAEVLGWDYPLWGILGKRLWLRHTINWIVPGYKENFIFRRFEWQVTQCSTK